MFRKKNVIDFLYDVIKDESLEIYPFIKYVSMHEDVPCQNKISQSEKNKNLRVCQLSLNKKYFGVSDSNFLKGLLLHEIGHAIISSKSKSDNEYYAHLWAIEKANKMGLPHVVNKLILMVLEWGKMEWSDYRSRRYIMAYKKFKTLYNTIP